MVKDSIWQHRNKCYQPILLTINWFWKVCLLYDLCLINFILGIYTNSFFGSEGLRKARIHITKNMWKGAEANVNAMFLMRVSMLHSLLRLGLTRFTCSSSLIIMCLCLHDCGTMMHVENCSPWPSPNADKTLTKCVHAQILLYLRFLRISIYLLSQLGAATIISTWLDYGQVMPTLGKVERRFITTHINIGYIHLTVC